MKKCYLQENYAANLAVEFFIPSGLLGMKLQFQFVGFQTKKQLFYHLQILRSGFSTISSGSLNLLPSDMCRREISVPLQS